MAFLVKRTLDTRGLPVPLPVVKTERAMAELGPNEVLAVLASGPSASSELLAWVQRSGHELLQQGSIGRLHQFYIRKTDRPN